MKADLVEAEGLQAEGGRQRLSLLTSPLSRPSSQKDQEVARRSQTFQGQAEALAMLEAAEGPGLLEP